ncbi:hypothetical protein LTR17_013181 [Elasticomyces elasticus]|nr:hypothetical protein LTR17_013181 [Elasticomyces elasticus]
MPRNKHGDHDSEGESEDEKYTLPNPPRYTRYVERERGYVDLRCGHKVPARGLPNVPDMNADEMYRPDCIFCDSERQLPRDINECDRRMGELESEIFWGRTFVDMMITEYDRHAAFKKQRQKHQEWLESECTRVLKAVLAYKRAQKRLPESERDSPQRNILEEAFMDRGDEAALERKHGAGFRMLKKGKWEYDRDFFEPVAEEFRENELRTGSKGGIGFDGENSGEVDPTKYLKGDDFKEWERRLEAWEKQRMAHDHAQCFLRRRKPVVFVRAGFEELEQLDRKLMYAEEISLQQQQYSSMQERVAALNWEREEKEKRDHEEYDCFWRDEQGGMYPRDPDFEDESLLRIDAANLAVEEARRRQEAAEAVAGMEENDEEYYGTTTPQEVITEGQRVAAMARTLAVAATGREGSLDDGVRLDEAFDEEVFEEDEERLDVDALTHKLEVLACERGEEPVDAEASRSSSA